MNGENIKITAIYPSVDIHEGGNIIQIGTILRKEKDGIWYEHKIYMYYEFHDVDCDRKISALSSFHKAVYQDIILGVVNTSAIDRNGEAVYSKSEEQISEADRLIQMMVIIKSCTIKS